MYAMFQSPQHLYDLMEPTMMYDFGNNHHKMLTIITKIMYLRHYIRTILQLKDSSFEHMATYTFKDFRDKGLEGEWYKISYENNHSRIYNMLKDVVKTPAATSPISPDPLRNPGTSGLGGGERPTTYLQNLET
jgi:hypothetical protein